MKMYYFKTLVLALIILITGCNSQKHKLIEVKVASGGHLTHFLPFDLANQLGYFKEKGLKVNTFYLKGGSATAQALISGQADFSTNSIDHAFKSAAQGKSNLRMVVLMNQTPGMVLVVSSKLKSKIKSISDLKGLSLGVTSKGSASHMVLAYLLYKNGVSPDSVTIFNAGASTFSSALKHGKIDGGIALEPFASKMVEDGDAFVLQSLITKEETNKVFEGPYNLAGILTTKEYMENHSDAVEGFVTAIVKGLKYIQTHTPEEIAKVLPAEIVGTNKELYIETLKKLNGFYSPDGYIDPIGVKNVYNSLIKSGEIRDDKNINVKSFYTNKYVKKN